ncbi:uncharacterized protein LOC108332791 [Vigna angularis]|uniref:uncharacterized protein LOC108332791 n=1 Tax=Phaseolus angularis TaxID=3914 RepID=UPI0022B3394D|nr:uncharacterized protein LOC108332791 [Vigna angularis]
MRRMMESVLQAMQQHNVALVQQNTVALQQLKDARVSAEASQRQCMELMAGRRATASSSSSTIPAKEWSLESFLQHRPAKFTGRCTPDEADHWYKDMERLYQAKRFPYENKLAFTKYLLSGEASHWWCSTRLLLESIGTHISWDVFKIKFYEEYFPDSVRFAKELEFLQLVQGSMTVLEYADKFKHLLHFHTLAMNEEGQCRKFENGLRGDIKLMVAGLCIKQFHVLVERAKVMEKSKREVDGQQSQTPRVGGPMVSKGSSGSRSTPYVRPTSSISKSSSSLSSVLSGYSGQPGPITCYNCGGPHLKSVCPQLTEYRKCNRCGREGHYERDCRLGRRAGG